MLPQTNATLTKVESAADSDEWESSAAGDEKWSGEERCYLQEESERLASGGASDLLVHRSLIVDPDLDVEWSVGDTVSFRRFAEEESGQVKAVELRQVPGISLDSVKLVLEDA